MLKPEEKTILVVDDEEDVRDYFADILMDFGFNVVKAADGEEALERVREKKPDFISLDLVMPRKSGIKFLYELRHNRDWMDIPVVIVTAHARDGEGKKDFRDIFENKSFQGPKFYLEKPIDEQAYVRMICNNIGIEYKKSEKTKIKDRQRDELESMLRDADPETVAEMLRIMKEKN
jgi:CheY-like chemotaxis protein